MAGHAVISGGSIGGLFAAALLRRAGWQTTVLERSKVELSGRGAGIVTHELLIRIIAMTGASTDDLGVQVEERVAFDIHGESVVRLPCPQIVTSWDRVHSLLRALCPDGSYRLNQTVTDCRQDNGQVTVEMEEGRLEADLLIGADGFRSAIRGRMHPAVQPAYSGYVVWRALASEASLSPELRERIFGHFGFFLPTGTQILGYPIAGPGNDLRPGHRRYNFVWYAPVPQAELADMLTDATGHRHDVTIPPPLIRPDILARMQDFAARNLAAPFLEILDRAERPFFTPIYDHHSPTMAEGRVALAGDAACVARPHVGMGVTKAACDAEALARALSAAPVEPALLAYSAERTPAALLARDSGQRLGGYIFAGDAVRNRDGRANPNLMTILRETAVVP